jgi:Protein of unknown function (DUF2934)
MSEKQSKKKKSSDREKIAKLAYYKWEKAGKPNSDGVEFWLAAEAEHTRAEVDLIEVID